MTATIFQVTDEAVAILTDTLACDGRGAPGCFVDKVEVLPHADLAITADHYAPVGLEWAEQLRSQPVRSIDTVIDQAPAALSALWELVGGGHPTTVRIFGVSERDGVCRGYAFRSGRGFEPQPIPAGAVSINPAPSFTDYDAGSLEGWIALAARLRHDRSDGPPVIGGDLMLTTLRPGSVSVTRVHRFVDFEETWETIEQGVAA